MRSILQLSLVVACGLSVAPHLAEATGGPSRARKASVLRRPWRAVTTGSLKIIAGRRGDRWLGEAGGLPLLRNDWVATRTRTDRFQIIRSVRRRADRILALRAIRRLAEREGAPFRRFVVDRRTDFADLLGRWVPGEGNEPRWVDGPVVEAMHRGQVLVLEVKDISPHGLDRIQDLIRYNDLVLTEKHGEVLRPHERFRLIALVDTEGLRRETRPVLIPDRPSRSRPR